MISNDSDVNEYKKYSKIFVFSGANKAGMGEIDVDKQAQTIYNLSKNSSYFKRVVKLDEETEKKLLKLQSCLEQLDENPNLMKKIEGILSQKLIEYEKNRCFDRICCVLDMDMFYAAVEIRDQPHLKDLPVAVGGDSMISTSNYVARKYGVRAAMPGFIARKLCPNLVFVPCNFEKYTLVSGQIKAIIAEYDPNYQSHSLDEVYFDLTSAAKSRLLAHSSNGLLKEQNDFDSREDHFDVSVRYKPDEDSNEDCCGDIVKLRAIAGEILKEIRERIKTVTNGLTSSAGIANNFFLAKICADINKPHGQYELPPNRSSVLYFLADLPTRKVGGIGKVMEKMLLQLGMRTIGEVRNNLVKVIHAFKPATSEFLVRISMGIGSEEGKQGHEAIEATTSGVVTRKSIGCERTYSAKGISDPKVLSEKLHEICESVSEDMMKEGLKGKAVTVKVKDTQFNLHTRCQTSKCAGYPIQSVESIESIAKTLLESFMPINIRLLGVSVSRFMNSSCEANAASVDNKQRRVVDFLRKGQTSKESEAFSSSDHKTDATVEVETAKSESALLRQRNMEVIVIDDSSEGEDGNESTLLLHSSEDENTKESVSESGIFMRSIDDDSIIYLSDESHNERFHECSEANEGMKVIENYRCPVCGHVIPDSDCNMTKINLHIDKCLSQQHSHGSYSSSSGSKIVTSGHGASKRRRDDITSFFRAKKSTI